MTEQLRSHEADILARAEAGDFDGAATLTVERYAQEILSFLVVQLGDVTAAQDAYSEFAERVWKGLPGFAARSSLRTWLYQIARNVAHNYRAAAHRQPRRNLALSSPSVERAVQQSRERTAPHLRTETKDRFRALRRELTMEEQTLLVLRVDRRMAWRDLAAVMCEDADDPTLDREAARFRKRFQAVKAKLKQLAEERNLLDDGAS